MVPLVSSSYVYKHYLFKHLFSASLFHLMKFVGARPIGLHLIAFKAEQCVETSAFNALVVTTFAPCSALFSLYETKICTSSQRRLSRSWARQTVLCKEAQVNPFVLLPFKVNWCQNSRIIK